MLRIPTGPLKIYHEIERQNPGIRQYSSSRTLVSRRLDAFGWRPAWQCPAFTSRPPTTTRKLVDLPFFRHYLKDEGELDLPEALVFLTGSNNWRRFDSWPPREIESANLYMGRQGDPVLLCELNRRGRL